MQSITSNCLISRACSLTQKRSFLLLLTALSTFNASAENNASSGSEINDGLWKITLGAGAYIQPEYEGASHTIVKPVPFPNVEWNEQLFFSPESGLGIYAIKNDTLTVSAALDYNFGRKESDDKALAGLGNIAPGITANLQMEWQLSLLSPFIEYSKHLEGARGQQVTFGLSTFVPLTPSGFKNLYLGREHVGPILLASVSADWADQHYMADYFGVKSAQSTRSELSSYQASAGIKSNNIDLAFIFPINQKWSVYTLLGYSKLRGDAKNSPVVKDKSQLSGGLVVSYSF